MRESEIEKYLCKQVKTELNGRAFKWISPGLNGVPDRIIIAPMRRIWFVETKAPGKKLRKLQEWVAGLISSMGFVVLRIDTKEKVDRFIEEAGRNEVYTT